MASAKVDPQASSGGVASLALAPTGKLADDLSPMSLEPGLIIHGKYELLRPLGSGGVGFVLAARHIGFDDFVALKFLRPEFASHQEAVSRFTIEARASFKLRSEHVARMLDVDLYEGVPFIAMELLEGTDLRNLLETRKVLDVQPAVDYLLQACEALAAAHAIGVIHRDIKPENLFLLGDGAATDHLKVLDFGISKVSVSGESRRTNQALTRMAVGTPPYMSPEQVRASSGLDARSDLWSVGCVLYELLTGTAPFERVSLMQACAAVLEDEPAPPSQLRSDLPEGISDVIMRCLRKDAEQRFTDVASLAEALSPFGSGRFASYPARCRAHLMGEGLGRRSTPPSLAIAGAYPNAQAQSTLPPGGRAITVRLESHAPLTRRATSTTSTASNASAPSVRPLRSNASQLVAPAPAQPAGEAHPQAATQSQDDGKAPLHLPRRRTLQVVAWGAPIVVGGLLATYLAMAEQQARSNTGPHLHTLSELGAQNEHDARETHGSLDLVRPHKPGSSESAPQDGLPDDPNDNATLGTASLDEHAAQDTAEHTKAQTDELAQASATGTQRPADAPKSAPSASPTHERTGSSVSQHRSSSPASAHKHATTSSRAAEPKPKPHTTHVTGTTVKPQEPSASHALADPDVGF